MQLFFTLHMLRNKERKCPSGISLQNRRHIMKGVILWLVGLPIPVIILLYLTHVIQ